MEEATAGLLLLKRLAYLLPQLFHRYRMKNRTDQGRVTVYTQFGQTNHINFGGRLPLLISRRRRLKWPNNQPIHSVKDPLCPCRIKETHLECSASHFLTIRPPLRSCRGVFWPQRASRISAEVESSSTFWLRPAVTSPGLTDTSTYEDVLFSHIFFEMFACRKFAD